MAWEFTDAAGNRQGMTIAEFGEPGGPGMGGCPNGPLQSGPPAPTNIVAANVSNGIAVNWTPAAAIPGTPAIDGYEVIAVALNGNGSENSMIGKRIADPAATGTTLTGLDSGQAYNVEVVSYSAVGKTFPVVYASVETDSTPPAVLASPNGGSYAVPQQVTLTSSEIGSDIYFTTDGSDPVDNAGPINTATLFTTPITISGETTLKFAAFDPSGNVSPIVTQTFNITNDPVPAATSITSSSVGLNAVTLNWAAADPGSPPYEIAGYEIKAYLDAAGTILADTRNTSGTGTTATVDNLTGDLALLVHGCSQEHRPQLVVRPGIGPVRPGHAARRPGRQCRLRSGRCGPRDRCQPDGRRLDVHRGDIRLDPDPDRNPDGPRQCHLHAGFGSGSRRQLHAPVLQVPDVEHAVDVPSGRHGRRGHQDRRRRDLATLGHRVDQYGEVEAG